MLCLLRKISPQQAPAVLSVTTHEVLLDVVVTDGGHAVTGLKSTDFIVTENGNPQVVASLQEHRPMTAATDAQVVAKPPLAPNTFTNYSAVANANAYTVILLDALNTRLDDQMSVREALIRYLKAQRGWGGGRNCNCAVIVVVFGAAAARLLNETSVSRIDGRLCTLPTASGICRFFSVTMKLNDADPVAAHRRVTCHVERRMRSVHGKDAASLGLDLTATQRWWGSPAEMHKANAFRVSVETPIA